MTKLIKNGIAIGILLLSASMPSLVLAGESFIEGQFRETIQRAGVAQGDELPSTESVIGIVLNSLLGFIGVAILLVVIYAGFLWASARGNDQQIDKAKKMLSGAIIGLLIVFTAAGVVNFIITSLSTVGGA